MRILKRRRKDGNVVVVVVCNNVEERRSESGGDGSLWKEKGVGRKETREGVVQLGESREVMSWDLIF